MPSKSRSLLVHMVVWLPNLQLDFWIRYHMIWIRYHRAWLCIGSQLWKTFHCLRYDWWGPLRSWRSWKNPSLPFVLLNSVGSSSSSTCRLQSAIHLQMVSKNVCGAQLLSTTESQCEDHWISFPFRQWNIMNLQPKLCLLLRQVVKTWRLPRFILAI